MIECINAIQKNALSFLSKNLKSKQSLFFIKKSSSKAHWYKKLITQALSSYSN